MRRKERKTLRDDKKNRYLLSWIGFYINFDLFLFYFYLLFIYFFFLLIRFVSQFVQFNLHSKISTFHTKEALLYAQFETLM